MFFCVLFFFAYDFLLHHFLIRFLLSFSFLLADKHTHGECTKTGCRPAAVCQRTQFTFPTHADKEDSHRTDTLTYFSTDTHTHTVRSHLLHTQTHVLCPNVTRTARGFSSHSHLYLRA